jgi:hypothetical protein
MGWKKGVKIVAIALIGIVILGVGWIMKNDHNSYIISNSCLTVCSDQCPQVQPSLSSGLRFLTQFYWLLLLIGSFILGYSVRSVFAK